MNVLGSEARLVKVLRLRGPEVEARLENVLGSEARFVKVLRPSGPEVEAR